MGAGILAIPAVTQESGFLASSVAVILCWVYMVIKEASESENFDNSNFLVSVCYCIRKLKHYSCRL